MTQPETKPEAAGPTMRKPEAPPSLAREFLQFLRERKLLWLSPIFIILLLLSALMFFTQGSALAPFIYAIF